MAKITINSIADKKSWEDFISTHPEANFLQSWYWGEFHESIGDKVHRLGFYNSGKLIGVLLAVVEDAKRGRYLTVPGGPIIDWTNMGVVELFIDRIKELARNEKCVFIRVRPQLETNDFSVNLFKKNGFRNAPMHLHAELTSQLDITKSEEELMANMRKATRYEIRKAISEGISILKSDKPQEIKKFYDMQLLTSKRHNFVPFSYEFLHEQFEAFSKVNNVFLYEAKFGRKSLAQAFIIFYGKEAVYHYGASTEDGRKHPGAYIIQWEAIKEAKKRGMTRYNFWGVSPETDNGHRFDGISVFKRGFGGRDVSYLHAQDLIINYPKYLLNFTVEHIRKKMRKV